jgi:hypothetical protein
MRQAILAMGLMAMGSSIQDLYPQATTRTVNRASMTLPTAQLLVLARPVRPARELAIAADGRPHPGQRIKCVLPPQERAKIAGSIGTKGLLHHAQAGAAGIRKQASDRVRSLP